MNKKGRRLSNARILELLVEHGVETPEGLLKLAPGRLTASPDTATSGFDSPRREP